jgi:hypothetical protein
MPFDSLWLATNCFVDRKPPRAAAVQFARLTDDLLNLRWIKNNFIRLFQIIDLEGIAMATEK